MFRRRTSEAVFKGRDTETIRAAEIPVTRAATECRGTLIVVLISEYNPQSQLHYEERVYNAPTVPMHDSCHQIELIIEVLYNSK
jgi:hypothetical protein